MKARIGKAWVVRRLPLIKNKDLILSRARLIDKIKIVIKLLLINLERE
jgi:hypothetical protein